MIALMDQRVVHAEDFDARHPFVQPCQMGVVFPQCISRRTDIRLKLPRMSNMQVPNGGGEHDDITGTLK